MRPLKKHAWGITALFLFSFIFYSTDLPSNLANSPGFMFGLIGAFSLIPALFWLYLLIAFIINKSNGAWSLSGSIVTTLKDRKKKIKKEIRIKNKTLSLLNNSLEQGIITEHKLQSEGFNIQKQINILEKEKNIVWNRILAINNLQSEFSNLYKLQRNGIMNQLEYESKVEELIEIYIENYL